MSWKLYEGDCFDYLPQIEDKSIDMILCDLPYGTTQNKWDSLIPLDKLWKQYQRIIKDNGAICLTSTQPFTSNLIMSNPQIFKYEWVWDKNTTNGFLNAKKQPLRRHENILIFYKTQCTYNPQMVQGTPYNKGIKRNTTSNYGKQKETDDKNIDGLRYPRSILYFDNNNRTNILHPTQKPVKLFEYLIKTYTNEGELVLDNCAGSGTTGVACENLNRNSILMEKEPEYCQLIKDRMKEVTNQTKLKMNRR